MDGASRSSRWPTVVVGAAALLLCLGVLGGLYFGLLSRLRAAAPPPPSGPTQPTADATPRGPGCPPVRMRVANLGEFAWTAGGQLMTYSLKDCAQKTVV